MRKEKGGVYAPCDKCMGATGWVDPDCPRCGGKDGYMEVTTQEDLTPKSHYLHDWFCMHPLTSPILIVERLWICLKCGDTSEGRLPTVFGCDTSKEVSWDDVDNAMFNPNDNPTGAD